ncbi:MAG: RluA family pseudouridine synthase [Candidatus Caldatribacteriota bacterium]|nr:RluA family pseudouridine synthase [Candidatus Caldatribacteriota bacterium]
MNKERVVSITSNEKMRIDRYLNKEKIYHSRSQIQNLITQGQIKVNSVHVKPSYILKNGDKINLYPIETKELKINAENIPLDIIHEDNYLIVINKPVNMIVHPVGRICSKTLVNAVLFHCKGSLSGINGTIRPGIVHRLDKNTTGLIVIAKNDTAHLSLSKQIADRKVTKKYLALVRGEVKENFGTIDAPIGRSMKNRKKMAVIEQNSKEAISNFKVVRRFSNYTLLEVTILTGRTHQIRVHLAYIGFPVVGDPDYGHRRKKVNINRQALHAYILGFSHPFYKKYIEFKAPLPKDMEDLIKSLKEKKNKSR